MIYLQAMMCARATSLRVGVLLNALALRWRARPFTLHRDGI